MFLIGEVAKKLGIHDQTIRMYERKIWLNLKEQKITQEYFRTTI